MDLVEKMQNKNRHPWELSRTQCILNIIRNQNLNSVADIGAGDNYFTTNLRQFVPGLVYAIDTGYSEKTKSDDAIHYLSNISALPNLNGKCGILLMDVLEHIENDSAFLKSTLEKISVGSTVLITVPAFQFLFSEHDQFLKHYRRYNRKQLLNLIKTKICA